MFLCSLSSLWLLFKLLLARFQISKRRRFKWVFVCFWYYGLVLHFLAFCKVSNKTTCACFQNLEVWWYGFSHHNTYYFSTPTFLSSLTVVVQLSKHSVWINFFILLDHFFVHFFYWLELPDHITFLSVLSSCWFDMTADINKVSIKFVIYQSNVPCS